MSGFHIGCVVVCVDISPSPEYGNDPDLAQLKLRGIYRVEAVTHGGAGIRVTPSRLKEGEGFHVWRFRPVVKASERFAQQMRALKPARRRVPA